VCSAYTILDIVNLVDFLIETRREYRDFNWSLWRAITPTQINFSLLNKDLTDRALEQVQMSLTKLLSSEFNDQFFLPGIKELKSYTLELEKNNYLNFDDFVQFTGTLDRSRNESFEQVFGYKIY
jgi:hypothetical protein